MQLFKSPDLSASRQAGLSLFVCMSPCSDCIRFDLTTVILLKMFRVNVSTLADLPVSGAREATGFHPVPPHLSPVSVHLSERGRTRCEILRL